MDHILRKIGAFQPFTSQGELRIYERLSTARVVMGLSYLLFQQPSQLVAVDKPTGKLLMLEADPVPLHIDHLRTLISGSKDALGAILDCPPFQLGTIRSAAKPVCNVTPDIVVEAGKRLEVIEIMAERPHGLAQARRFDKALGTDRLQSEGVRQALTEAGFESLRARTSMVTIVAPDFTPAQQSAALRLGFRLRRMVMGLEEGTDKLYLVFGSPKDDFPSDQAESVGERRDLAATIADEVSRFLAATEWKVNAPDESMVRVFLELPGRNEPISMSIRPLITTQDNHEPGLLVELSVKDGTRAVDARRIELGWGDDFPVRCDGARLWRTVVSLDGGPEHAIPRLLFPVKEVHDAVESARVS